MNVAYFYVPFTHSSLKTLSIYTQDRHPSHAYSVKRTDVQAFLLRWFALFESMGVEITRREI